jgi:hypothetical protein
MKEEDTLTLHNRSTVTQQTQVIKLDSRVALSLYASYQLCYKPHRERNHNERPNPESRGSNSRLSLRPAKGAVPFRLLRSPRCNRRARLSGRQRRRHSRGPPHRPQCFRPLHIRDGVCRSCASDLVRSRLSHQSRRHHDNGCTALRTRPSRTRRAVAGHHPGIPRRLLRRTRPAPP